VHPSGLRDDWKTQYIECGPLHKVTTKLRKNSQISSDHCPFYPNSTGTG